MRLSNKSTFSLACLVLLLAFVAIPAWSHPIVTDATTDPVTYDSTHGNDPAAHPAHAIAKTITLMGDASDGYVGTDSFIIAIEFDSAGGTPIAGAFTAVNIDITGETGTWTVRDVTGSGLSYTARILPDSTATSDDPDVVIALTGSVDVSDDSTDNAQAIFSPPNADGDDADTDPDTGPEADRANSAKAVVNLDVTPPVIADGTTPADTAGPAIQPLGSDLAPLPGTGWSKGFRVVFIVPSATGTDADESIDLSTLKFTADPDVLEFGTRGGTGVANQYAVDVDYKNVDVAADTDVTITIELSDKAGNKSTVTVMVKLAMRTMTDDDDDDDDMMDPTDPDEGPTVSSVFTIPANSFIVVVRETGDRHTDGKIVEDEDADPVVEIVGAAGLPIGAGDLLKDVSIETWAEMPNLRTLFSRSSPGGGGAIALRQSVDQPDDKQLAVGTVGISEIMWVIDAGYLGKDGEDASQWIELHNLNEFEAKVYLTTATGTDITNDQTLIGGSKKDDGSVDPEGGALVAPTIDVVTNFFDNRPGNGAWDLPPGSNGSSKSGVDFKSMARVVPGDSFDKNRKNNDGHLIARFNNKDGRDDGNWQASTLAYITTATDNPDSATTGVPTEYSYIGTPGRVNSFKPAEQPHKKDARTNVPASPVIINEVANRSNADYEWIELRNVTDVKQDLRNMLISVVTSNSSDVPLIQMPNDDKAQIAPEGVFLLVASNPRDNPNHPLAVGWDVDLNAEDQVDGLAAIGINASSKHGRYRVVNFENGGLPDGDGQKFVLILRSKDGNHDNRSGRNDGEGVAETGAKDLNRILDIGGYDDNLGKVDYSNAVSKTDLWPLQNFEGPASSLNRFLVDRVVRRQHFNAAKGKTGVGTNDKADNQGHVSFGPTDYSGIGYKRQASKSKAHGGTPGYHGNEKGSAVDAELVISEIMLSQGTGRVKLPQWIEIYNPTDYAVQLDAGDGWRLIIENPGRDQEIRTINFKSKGDVKRVLPNETILVVSYRARANIGHDRFPDTTAFPETRVFDVFEELKAEFEMDNRSTPILNSEAFRMTLVDGSAIDTNALTPTDAHKKVGSKYYTISDDVGNLDGNARTNDEGMWKYPDGMDPEDGSRSSLIRVFDDRDARPAVSMDESDVLPIHAKQVDAMVDLGNVDGPMIPDKYSWVQAFQVEFGRIRNRTWFGDEDDDGTPATRVSQILPVELSSFRPALQDGKVTIRWTTESELDNAGFNILRSETRNGEYKQVNTELIQGAGTTGERNAYKWVDATAKPGVVYYYQIEDVSFAGEHQVLATTKLKGLISATNKLTTTWGELKEVQ